MPTFITGERVVNIHAADLEAIVLASNEPPSLYQIRVRFNDGSEGTFPSGDFRSVIPHEQVPPHIIPIGTRVRSLLNESSGEFKGLIRGIDSSSHVYSVEFQDRTQLYHSDNFIIVSLPEEDSIPSPAVPELRIRPGHLIKWLIDDLEPKGTILAIASAPINSYFKVYTSNPNSDDVYTLNSSQRGIVFEVIKLEIGDVLESLVENVSGVQAPIGTKYTVQTILDSGFRTITNNFFYFRRTGTKLKLIKKYSLEEKKIMNNEPKVGGYVRILISNFDHVNANVGDVLKITRLKSTPGTFSVESTRERNSYYYGLDMHNAGNHFELLPEIKAHMLVKITNHSLLGISAGEGYITRVITSPNELGIFTIRSIISGDSWTCSVYDYGKGYNIIPLEVGSNIEVLVTQPNGAYENVGNILTIVSFDDDRFHTTRSDSPTDRWWFKYNTFEETFKLLSPTSRIHTAKDIEVGDEIEFLVDECEGAARTKVGDRVKITSLAGDMFGTNGLYNQISRNDYWSFHSSNINKTFKLIKRGSKKATKEKPLFVLKTKGNKATLDFKLPVKRVQRKTVEKLIETGDYGKLAQYLSTFQGKKNTSKDRVKPDRFKVSTSAIDKLGERKKNHFAIMLDALIDPAKNHIPTSEASDYFGVEIECFIPFSSLAMEYGDADLERCSICDGSGEYEDSDDGSMHTCHDCDGSGSVVTDDAAGKAHSKLRKVFKETKIKRATVKSDSSIRPTEDHFAVEITVLSRLSDTKNLMQTCELLKRLKGKVNKSCGMHVHLDARHQTKEDIKLVANSFKRALPVMLDMVSKNRRSNTYCQPRVSSDDRYSAVNLTAYDKYKTIEIRLHSSTTNYSKIMNWVHFMNAIRNAKNIPRVCDDINELTEYVDISQDLMEYIGQRTALFAEKSTATNPEVVDSDDTDEPLQVIPITRAVTEEVPVDWTSIGWTSGRTGTNDNGGEGIPF